MRFYAGEVLSAALLYSGIYALLVFLLTGFDSMALWALVWLVGIGGPIALTFIAANQGESINRPSTFFALAVAAVLALGCLTLSPHTKSSVGFYAMLVSIASLGIPLGVGGVRLFLGSWRPMSAKAIVVGALAGIVSISIFVPIMFSLGGWGLKAFVAVPSIPTVNLLAFDIFPWWQSSTVVRRTLLREPLGELKLPGLFFLLALLFQGLQSTLAAVWNTLVLGLGALAASWVATRLLLQKQSRRS